jgi:hypothetical protein
MTGLVIRTNNDTLITNYMTIIFKRYDSLVVMSVKVNYIFKYVANGRAIRLIALEEFNFLPFEPAGN